MIDPGTNWGIICFYIGGLISFIGPAVMILTGMTSIGAILAQKWELLKRCPFCMLPRHGWR
jgi:hypothetical protein